MKDTLIRFVPIIAFAFASLQAADDPRLAQLRAADDERVAAVVKADRAQLAAILSQDLRYVHSTGAVDTKTSFLELVGTGRTKYLGWNYTERRPVPDPAWRCWRWKRANPCCSNRKSARNWPIGKSSP